MESCTFEVRQYSAYWFRLPSTPGMRLVQFKHDQQGQQRYGPQSTQTRLRHQEPCPVAIPISHHHSPVRSQISIHSILYSISHILEYKDNYKSREQPEITRLLPYSSRVTGNHSTSKYPIS